VSGRDGGGDIGQGRAVAVHGGIQTEEFARGGGLHAGRGDRGAVSARGSVLVKSEQLAQVTGAQRAGGCRREDAGP
jgi:hypothetical protein